MIWLKACGACQFLCASREGRTDHALGPFVNDFDQAEFEIVVEAVLGEVGAVASLDRTNSLRDLEDGGLALRAS